jgi:hypothetical protein
MTTKELLALAEKATPCQLVGEDPGGQFSLAVRPEGTGFILASLPRDDTSGLFRMMGGTPQSNLAYIVAAANAVPDLCRRVEAAEALLREVVLYAKATHDFWDEDKDAKVGKRLAALSGRLLGYDDVTDRLNDFLAPLKDSE